MLVYDLKTYNELFEFITNSYKNNTFLNYINNKGVYSSISIDEFKEKVICLAISLKNIGVKKGSKVGIFAKPSPFWLIFDFAIQKIGAISVPIFDNISSKNLNFEIKDANIKYIFIDSIERIEDIQTNIIFITHNFCIKEKIFYNLDDIFHINIEKCDINDLEENKPNEDDIFSIIYTSGNTGTPKGVQLSHKNIISQVKDVNSFLKISQDRSILSLLPLAHIFERMVMSYYLSRGVSIYFVDDIKNVSSLLKVVKPTMITAVPRLLEKIYNKIQLNIENKSLLLKALGKFAFSYANSQTINKNALIYRIFDKLVYKKLRDIFGGRLETLVSGGAVLDKQIAQFFTNIGVPIYQGYGLTESSPVISTNYPNNNKIGSSGKALPSVEVKILDGELCVKGPSIMKGYLNNKKLTDETIDKEGWLHTGDIASIDEDGYVFIKSRKKDIYKLSTGKYVSTVPIEIELSKNKYIEFALIIANNKKYVTALVFVDKEIYNNDIINKEISIEEYFNSNKVKHNIQKTINKINKKVNTWEKIIDYSIITNQISIESGELTPSMKICRGIIESKYEEIINKMY